MRRLLFDIRKGVSKNIKPGIMLQSLGLMLVLSYYFLPDARPVFDGVMQLKEKYGYVYSAVATALFGAIIPLIILSIMGRRPASSLLLRGFVLILFWMWKGAEVDLFYHLQTYFFGSEPGVSTVIKKVLFDQCVYNPVWAAPSMIIFYAWMDESYSFKALFRKWKSGSLLRTLVTVVVSTWVVWGPAAALVYSLPVSLQVPVYNLVLCFWVLVFDIVSRNGKEGESIKK